MTKVNKDVSLKTLLLPLLQHPTIAAIIKWSVYGILVFNGVIYVLDDIGAYQSSIGADASFADVLETFATSIDTAAWIGLIFLLELETWLLSDEVLESWIGKLLFSLRVLCYVSIAYAAYGYVAEAQDNYKVMVREDVKHLCDVAGQGIYLQTDSIDYTTIEPSNCNDLSVGAPFYKIDKKVSLIDAPTLQRVQKMEWINVVNAFVWVIVVLLIEAEVRLQWNDQYGTRWLQGVQQSKTFFYVILWGCAFAWLYFGYRLYGFDAIVWIAGFWAIELNLADWEQERVAELRAQEPST
ncbi:MAG: hypothetical protein AB8B48_22290 [Pseudomonadales bacterium]